MTEQTTAWVEMNGDGARAIHTAAGPVTVATEQGTRSLTGLELAAAALAVDVLDAFVHVSRQLDVAWSSIEGEVSVERGDHPRRITRVEYQLRVVSTEPTVVDIAAHDLEAAAPVLASLVAAERSGHVVVVPPNPT